MKHSYIVPLAGRGQRFIDAGYSTPKQMLQVGEQSCWEWSCSSLDLNGSNVVFVIRKESQDQFGLGDFLRANTPADCQVVQLSEHTRGSLETCLTARPHIPDDHAVTIFTGDVMFAPRYVPGAFLASSRQYGGWLLTFKSNSNGYSYVETDSSGVAIRTAEKVVISDRALVGIYGFKRADQLWDLADAELDSPPPFGAEYYIAPLYNRLISSGGAVLSASTQEMHVFGTPAELDFFDKHASRTFARRVVGVCGDHSGFEVKNQLMEVLRHMNLEVIDFGPYVDVDCDYTDYVEAACKAMNSGAVDAIFSSCRSGQGVNIAASAFPGVWPTIIYDISAGSLAVEHNCSNFFSFPSRLWADGDLEKACSAIIQSRFQGGRHQGRVMRIAQLKAESYAHV
jgi:RpiB/LacA/LacB family sugar-phosphate isomerase